MRIFKLNVHAVEAKEEDHPTFNEHVRATEKTVGKSKELRRARKARERQQLAEVLANRREVRKFVRTEGSAIASTLATKVIKKATGEEVPFVTLGDLIRAKKREAQEDQVDQMLQQQG